jgi:hypothetical protein
MRKAAMEYWWTLIQASIWAATRDLEEVVAVGSIETRVLLFAEQPAAIQHIIAWREHLAAQQRAPVSAAEAFQELLFHCASGNVTMHGVEMGNGDVTPIPNEAWGQLKIFENEGGLYAAPAHHNPTARWWSNLRIARDDAMRLWLPVPAAPACEAEVSLVAAPSVEPPVELATSPIQHAAPVGQESVEPRIVLSAEPPLQCLGRNPPPPKPEEWAATKRRAGAKPSKRETLKLWILGRFPGGRIPPSIKNATVLDDFHKDTGGSANEKTLRRAMIEIEQENSGQNPVM